MIVTQPYCLPTISGLYEMCSAGGGESKLYRPLLPFNPDEVVWCGCESFIGDDLSFSAINHTIVAYPVFSVPDFHFCRYVLYRHKPNIGQYKLVFGDASQFSDFALLPEMPIDAVLLHGNAEHLTGTHAVDVTTAAE